MTSYEKEAIQIFKAIKTGGNPQITELDRGFSISSTIGLPRYELSIEGNSPGKGLSYLSHFSRVTIQARVKVNGTAVMSFPVSDVVASQIAGLAERFKEEMHHEGVTKGYAKLKEMLEGHGIRHSKK